MLLISDKNQEYIIKQWRLHIFYFQYKINYLTKLNRPLCFLLIANVIIYLNSTIVGIIYNLI